MKLKEEIIFEELEDEGYLYNTENDNLFSLNPTGRLILHLIKEGKEISEIKGSIIEKFEVDEKTAEKDLNEFVDSLKKQNFVN